MCALSMEMTLCWCRPWTQPLACSLYSGRGGSVRASGLCSGTAGEASGGGVPFFTGTGGDGGRYPLGLGPPRRPCLRDGRVNPEDPYGWRHYDDVVKITDGVISAVACSDRTLAVLEGRLPVAAPQRRISPGMGGIAGSEPRRAGKAAGPGPDAVSGSGLCGGRPAPAVVESASLEVWEAQQEETEAEPEAQVPQPVPEPPRRPNGPEQSSAAGLVTAALSAAVLASWGGCGGKLAVMETKETKAAPANFSAGAVCCLSLQGADLQIVVGLGQVQDHLCDAVCRVEAQVSAGRSRCSPHLSGRRSGW